MRFRFIFLYFLLMIISIAFSSSTSDCTTVCSGTISELETALQCLCCTLYDYISLVAFIMITLSSLVYALGNMFGAETRARANVWATSMLTGAIIGLVLIIIVPAFLATLLGYTSFDSGSCEFT